MRKAAFVAALTIALSGCADEPEPLVTGGDFVVAVDRANAARVEEDRIIFPAHLISEELRAKIDAYDDDRWFWQDDEDVDVERVIFVSDRENWVTDEEGVIDTDADNPFGFIRRALSYKLDEPDIIIKTEDASVADVYRELDENGAVRIQSDYPTPKHAETIFIDKSGLELWRDGDEYIRFPSLFVNIDPEVDIGLNVGAFAVKRAHMTVTADIETQLVVDARITRELPEQAQRQTIYDESYKLAPLGIIPVSMRVRIDVGCEKTGEGVELEGGMNAKSSVRGDLVYERASGTDLSGEGTFEPSLIGSKFHVTSGTEATLKCIADPHISILYFDLEAGSFTANAHVDLQMTTPPDAVRADAKVFGQLTGVMSSLGADLQDENGTLIDVDKTLWDGPVP